MLTNSKIIRITDFSGGVNINTPKDMIEDNELYANIDTYDGTKNVLWTHGGLYKIGGIQKVNSTEISNSTIINGIRLYKNTTPEMTTIVAADNGTNVKIYYLDSSNVFQEITGGTAIPTGSKIDMTVWKGNLYIATGNTLLQKVEYSSGWTKSDLSSLSEHPQYVVQHKDRLFVAGGNITQGQVWATDYEYDNKWYGSGGEIFNFGVNDGDPITRLISLGDDLIVYKNDSIWYLSGDNITNWFEKVGQKSIGCVAPFSVADTPYGHIFLGADNIYLFTGNSLTPIGYNIKPWLDLIPYAMKDEAVSVYHDQYYHIAFAKNGSSVNDFELVLDLRYINEGKLPWWPIDGRVIGTYIKYDGPNDNNYLYYGSGNSGYLYQTNIGPTNDGANIDMEVHTKYFSAEQPHIDKAYGRLMVDIANNTGDTKLTIKKDIYDSYEKSYTISTGGETDIWSSSGAEWGTASWVGDTSGRYTFELLMPPEFDGKHLALHFENDDVYEGTALYSITLNTKLKGY